MKVGVLGGGQLGRMLALAGIPHGHEFFFLDPKDDVCGTSVGTHVVGTYDDEESLKKLAELCDVITYETENLPVGCIDTLSSSVEVFPSQEVLAVTQDRLEEKTVCNELGVPTAQFVNVENEDNLQSALDELGLPSILKTRRMGYDGKGQVVLRDESALADAKSLCAVPCILEKMVMFTRELSIVSTRSKDGEIVYYPLTENVHKENILFTSRAPVDVDPKTEEQARSIAEKLLTHFEYVGTMTIEFFHMEDGQLLLNEIAPRVHNSGHWTIEGAQTSQFENHVRAICGMPLGSVSLRGFSGLVNILGSHPDLSQLLQLDGVHVHFYGKGEVPKRKIGHVTICCDSEEQLSNQIQQVLDIVSKAHQ